jgi:hypothetical protein
MDDHVPEGFLADRERALEEQFFARQDVRLIQEMREHQRAENAKDLVAVALGVDRSAVPDELTGIELAPESVTAFAMVPLIAVAWADGRIDKKERTAILAAAQEAGIASGSASHQLFTRWIEQPPPNQLLDAWRGYVAALCGGLSSETRLELQRHVSGRARRVAEASGGLLGFGGKVSDREEQALREIEEAFRQPAT